MSLCELNSCDLKYLQRKFDAINKKINDNQKIQDKINANIFELLKESGINVEALFKNYYALNEEDYTKTLTSEDDINTLEPGTYKIVKEDMPQNAPDGIGIATYNGTLIKSQNYMALFEDTGFHFAAGIVLNDNVIWTWYHYISKTQIDLLLFNYMKIRNYDKFNYSDVHDLTGFAAGVYTVDASVKNLPVASEGLLIIRQGVNKTDNYIVMFLPQNSNEIYKCYKRTDGAWSRWEQFAFVSDVPNLAGYATQEWVNQQIQDITGGGVTADWVKANFSALNNSQYIQIEANTDLNVIVTPGVYKTANTILTLLNRPDGVSNNCAIIIVFNSCYSNTLFQFYIEQNTNKVWSRFYTSTEWRSWVRYALSSEIPSLSGYATQSWVQSQNYLTEIPDEYATNTEVSQTIATALVGYATQAWVNSQGFAKETDIPSLTGYATQSWVNSQGFLTEIPDEYLTLTELQAQNYATQSWVTGKGYQTSTQVSSEITKALNGYATQTWVNQQNFAHESDIPSLSGYATQSWVNSRNYATEEWVGQQGYQTVQQVNSLINTATADMLTQEDLDTLNYATENWVLQTALNEYATTDDVTNATSKNNILKYQLDHSYFNLLSTNDDLNNLSIGVHASDSSAITSTLLNKPEELTGGFKLTMSEIIGEAYCSQTIIENITGNIFIRCSENKIWNEWRKI